MPFIIGVTHSARQYIVIPFDLAISQLPHREAHFVRLKDYDGAIYDFAFRYASLPVGIQVTEFSITSTQRRIWLPWYLSTKYARQSYLVVYVHKNVLYNKIYCVYQGSAIKLFGGSDNLEKNFRGPEKT